MNQIQLEELSKSIGHAKRPLLEVTGTNFVMLEFLLCYQKFEDQGVRSAIAKYQHAQKELLDSLNRLHKTIALKSTPSTDYDI